jgi:FAD/FMN-containing dehydrogenase
VVLANGEAIETCRLNRKELNKKLGLATFEGEIYRAIDALIEENQEAIEKTVRPCNANSSGYCLSDVRHKDGSFDLTPLFVGSQGTLGIITEVCIETEPYNPETTLVVAGFDDLDKLQTAVLELRKLPDMPSAIEMVDDTFLATVERISPNYLKSAASKPYPKAILFVEYNNHSERAQRKIVKRAVKALHRYTIGTEVIDKPEEQEKMWKIRRASSMILGHAEGNAKALPILDDGCVPPQKLKEYIEGIYDICNRNHVFAAVWGHAGNASLKVQPYLDLGEVGDRQKLFRLMDEYYNLIISLGGCVSSDNGDGRLRAPYLSAMYSSEVYTLFQKVKQIFDPYGTLNPGVKIDVSFDDIKPLLRSGYTLNHLHDHLPRS